MSEIVFKNSLQDITFKVAYAGINTGTAASTTKGLPPGGMVDEILVKKSTSDGDAKWTDTVDGGGF